MTPKSANQKLILNINEKNVNDGIPKEVAEQLFQDEGTFVKLTIFAENTQEQRKHAWILRNAFRTCSKSHQAVMDAVGNE